MAELLEISGAILAFMFFKYAFLKSKISWRSMLIEYLSIVIIVWIMKSIISFSNFWL